MRNNLYLESIQYYNCLKYTDKIKKVKNYYSYSYYSFWENLKASFLCKFVEYSYERNRMANNVEVAVSVSIPNYGSSSSIRDRIILYVCIPYYYVIYFAFLRKHIAWIGTQDQLLLHRWEYLKAFIRSQSFIYNKNIYEQD